MLSGSKVGVRQGKTNAEAVNDDERIAMNLEKGKPDG
jgi:hypothetical protein